MSTRFHISTYMSYSFFSFHCTLCRPVLSMSSSWSRQPQSDPISKGCWIPAPTAWQPPTSLLKSCTTSRYLLGSLHCFCRSFLYRKDPRLSMIDTDADPLSIQVILERCGQAFSLHMQSRSILIANLHNRNAWRNNVSNLPFKISKGLFVFLKI